MQHSQDLQENRAMPIDKPDFDSIAEQDLQELVDFGIPEGLKYEYKSALYGDSDSDKKEALKDISSFANSSGGHLVLGIQEHHGVPKVLTGVSVSNPDAEVLRLDQLARSGIEPRITAIRIRAIPLTNSKHAIVVRIPKSWNCPHRVNAKNTNRFYLRSSGGVHEANVEELRRLFMISSSTRENIRKFRDERVEMIVSGRGPLTLHGAGRLILHIVPLAAFESNEHVDLNYAFTKDAMFRPIDSFGYTPRYNFDGFLIYKGDDPRDGYTQIFRNGILEATRASILSSEKTRYWIPALSFSKQIIEILPKYINGLQAIGVTTPLALMITVEGIKGAYLNASKRFDPDNIYAIDRSVLCLPEILIEEYGLEADYQKAIRPAFDALWNSAGYAACGYFDENDTWIGDKNNE